MSAQAAREVRVGVIGLGFMGRTHIGAYRAAATAGIANRLVAVCDADEGRRRGEVAAGGNIQTSAGEERLFDPDAVRGYEGAEELLADPEVDLVSICTYTDTHTALALAALRAGKHVLLEKPVALDSEDAGSLAAAAADAETMCMPAMCMRFWPGWDWLRHQIGAGELGAVTSASFCRLGGRPGWSADFYTDAHRCGGALFDLHVHDADFVQWCFGPPDEVTAAGTLDHLTALYHFDRGPAHVSAEGGWDLSPGAPFRMRFTVAFEDATADFELGRDPALVLYRDGAAQPILLPDSDGYRGEVAHLLASIQADDRALTATMAEAAAVIELLEAERRSLESGGRETV